jgi:hypothetical protein
MIGSEARKKFGAQKDSVIFDSAVSGFLSGQVSQARDGLFAAQVQHELVRMFRLG